MELRPGGAPAREQRVRRDDEDLVRLRRPDEAHLGRRGERPETVADAVAAVEREVEDIYGVGVELIVVGDCPMDDGVAALVGACREATVNAAKWSGCAQLKPVPCTISTFSSASSS